MSLPPKKLRVVSDSNEMELVDTFPSKGKDKETFYIYLYKISGTKAGSELPIAESELKKNLSNGIFIEIS